MSKDIKIKETYIPRFTLGTPKNGIKKYMCPNCKDNRLTFTRYIDVTVGEYIGKDFGRCDREIKCGYHLAPTGKDLGDKTTIVSATEVKEGYLSSENIINLIDSKNVIKSLLPQKNFFVKFLLNHYDRDKVENTLKRYLVGSSSKWEGSTIFWQVDKNYDVRTGKIMLYNEEDCKRVKKPFNHILWAHTPDKDNPFGYKSDFSLTQCFFGEHLLNENHKTCNIVESEKTAILCSMMRPDTLWLATGGLQNISEHRLYSLRDKELIFYPDKGQAVQVWKKKLRPLMGLFNIKVDTSINNIDSLLEGEDLGDYAIQQINNHKN